MVTFITPEALIAMLALPPLWALWWLARDRATGLPSSYSCASLCARSLALAALAGSLAGAQIALPSRDLTVVFLLDRSDSIAPDQRGRAEAYVQQALAHLPPNDRAGIVSFGQQATVERLPAGVRTAPPLDAWPGGARTNIADAIRLALGLLPSVGQRRLVLVSDGGANAGDTGQAARLAAARGVPLDIVSLGASIPAQDLRISAVTLPPAAREGERLQLSVSTESPTATPATLTVRSNGRVVISRQVQVPAGSGTLSVDLPTPEPAFNRYEVRLTSDGDGRPENNVAETYTVVGGKPNVLLVEGHPGEAASLRDALKAASFRVSTIGPERAPTRMADLSEYDAFVLVDVPLRSLPAESAKLLPAYVRDLGRGLAMIGGGESFGAGGYRGSPIEEALPVAMDLHPQVRTPPVAVAIVIDISGSMAIEEEGVPKVRLAARGAARIAQNLRDDDEITVIPFDHGPVGTIGPRAGYQRDDVIATLEKVTTAGAGITMYSALAEAARFLRASDKPVRHLITITDGNDTTQHANSPELARQLSGEGVTISTVAIGDGEDVSFLKEIARLGGGRFFLTDRAASIPDILLDDTQVLLRPFLVEGPFVPRAAPGGQGRSSPLHGIAALPPLLGYVASTPKDRAQVLLWTPQDDPLLATWQYGLGHALAWTSDLKGQWGRDLVRWDGFPRLAAQLIGWLAPPPGSPRLSVQSRASGDQIVLSASARDDSGRPASGLNLAGELLAADGSVRPVVLREIQPGSYGAVVDQAAAGAYQLRVLASQGDGKLFATAGGGAILPLGSEYGDNAGGDELLAELAHITGGRASPPPEAVFDLAGLGRGASRDLAQPLLWLALALLPLDVAIRRLPALKKGGGASS